MTMFNSSDNKSRWTGETMQQFCQLSHTRLRRIYLLRATAMRPQANLDLPRKPRELENWLVLIAQQDSATSATSDRGAKSSLVALHFAGIQEAKTRRVTTADSLANIDNLEMKVQHAFYLHRAFRLFQPEWWT